MKIEIINEKQIQYHCENCKSKLSPVTGDCYDDNPFPLVKKGTDWSYYHWYCDTCKIDKYSISLGIVSEIFDDYFIWDCSGDAAKEQLIWITYDNHRVFGHELFNANHENPGAGYCERSYKMMGEYTFGPYDTMLQARDLAIKLYQKLIDRVQKEKGK